MARFWSLNNTPATGAIAFYLFKETLKSASWTAVSSSDGTTYNAAGDQITSGNSGAGGFDNTRAWIRMRDPAGVRELILQRTTTNLLWRIKLSPVAKFSGGTPGATTTPSATDEITLVGGGTDAAGTGVQILGTNGAYRFHVMAESAGVYGFYYFTYPTGGGNPNGGFVWDPLTQTAAGDPDPYVYYLSQNSANSFRGSAGTQDFTTENGTHTPKAYLGAVATTTNFVGALPALPGVVPSGFSYAAACPANPFSGENEGVPFWYGRRNALTAPRGYKGFSSFMRANITTGLSTGTTGATLTWILVGDMWLPWDGVTVPTI